MNEHSTRPPRLLVENHGTFEDWTRESLRRRIESAAVVIAVLLSVAWVIGRIVLAGKPANVHGAFWIPVQIAIALAAGAAMRFSAFARAQPLFVSSIFFFAMSSAVAVHLGAMGGFDGPYFYAIYVIPPMTTILPCALRPRILLTLIPTLAFVLTFVLAYPEHLPYPMIHIPLLSTAASAVLSIVLGNAAYKLTKERYDLALEIERRARSEAREEARHALARTLHDDHAQITTAARLELKRLEQQASKSQLGEGDLAYLGTVLESLAQSSRQIVTNLRGSGEDEPLPTRLERMCRLLERDGEMRIERDFATFAAAPHEQETIYRFLQEALTNAIKHSAAKTVRASIAVENDAIVAQVADDGTGFDRAASADGWGLRGMQERIDAARGTLLIDSTARGTIITARLPKTEDSLG